MINTTHYHKLPVLRVYLYCQSKFLTLRQDAIQCSQIVYKISELVFVCFKSQKTTGVVAVASRPTEEKMRSGKRGFYFDAFKYSKHPKQGQYARGYLKPCERSGVMC